MMESVKKMALRICCAVLLLVLAGAWITGCKRGNDEGGLSSDTSSFAMRGRIVSINAPANEITLAHDAVPGFMEAMVMPYKVGVPEAMSELHSGDVITARLLVEKDKDGEYHNARLDRIVIVGQAKPDTVPQKAYNVPKPGDTVPDFKLVDQSNHAIHLAQLRGKAVLLTFIYTRCPLGDFCPRMSRNFAEIDSSLAKDKALYGKTDLLSVSFDPVYDTPAVLKSYGGAYTGNYTNEHFAHWQFAAPSKADLPKLEQYFNVGVTGSDATLTHSLSTVLIDPAGKIAAWYPGNDWKPADVIATMRTITHNS